MERAKQRKPTESRAEIAFTLRIWILELRICLASIKEKWHA